MRIIFDARVIQDHFPGIGRYAHGLLSALPAQLSENETLVALRDSSAQNTRFDLSTLNHPKLTWVEHHAPIFHPANLLHAPIPGSKSTLFHYPYYVRPYFGRLRSVTTLYDAISLVYPQLVPSASRRLLIRLLTDLAVRASTAFVTISQASARDIERHWPATRGRITVTPLAADAIFTPQTPERCAAVRAKYHLPERFTLYLASNKPHKNLVRLIDAWAILLSQSPTVRSDSAAPSKIENPESQVLVIAGHQDPRYPQARDRARALGIADRIRFIGEVSNADMPALYSACTLFVFPSLYEGFGLTPLEAMACGAPVVCSNTSSLPEVAGDAALLFDPTDIQAMATVCARVLTDSALQRQLRESSLRQAARFTWAETARRTLEVYRQIFTSASG
ncbi:MAG: glycosyltransferase family 4 protein [Anaerolineae bacterium]